MKNITIYSTPTCHFCHAAKEFFKTNNMEFTDVDVSRDPEKAKEMMSRSGQMGVPVIFIGEDMVIGFDESRIKSLLNI